MQHIIGLLVIVGLVSAASIPTGKMPKFGKEMADHINQGGHTFKAKSYDNINKKSGSTKELFNNFLGALTDPHIEAAKNQSKPHHIRVPRATLPVNFTVSDKWSNCASVFNTIQDQAACGSCWAVSSASVMQDRECIIYGPTVPISSWDLVSCCSACQGTQGNGCLGGFPTQAFSYFDNTGLTSGGPYGSNFGCKPYPITDSSTQPTSTPCQASCQSSWPYPYAGYNTFGNTYQVFSNNNAAVMQEIYNNGPVVATFTVYEDFMHYSSGVYQYTTGNVVGGHAVRIVGWGVTMSGTPYWRVANSWTSSWGDNGYVDFIRGGNNCGFEAGIVTGNSYHGTVFETA